jgi:hypothetical protein
VRRVRLVHITDGTSNTLGVVEAGPPVPWTKPEDIPFDSKKPLPKLAGPFSNALHVAFLDGSTYALRRNIKEGELKILIGMDDGMVGPDVRTLRASMPADTPEEKALLKKQIEENQKLIEAVEVLMKEHAALLGQRNQRTKDLLEVEERAEELRRFVEELKLHNARLRGESPGKPVAKDPPAVPSKK